MINPTVRLENGTIGTVDYYSYEGDISEHVDSEMNVHFHDENGNSVEESGIMVEVLEQ